MNRIYLPAVAILVVSVAVRAQTPAEASHNPSALANHPEQMLGSGGPLSREVEQAYQSVKKNILAAAAKVPEDDYSFKPTPEIRSFAEVFSHVVMAQSHTCAALASGEPVNPSKLSTKQDLQGALQNSFNICDKAYAALTDANAAEMIKTPRGQRTRLGALVGNTTHDVEQYATLAVYMRLKGLVPPSSEKPPAR